MEYTNLTLDISYGDGNRANTTININRECCDLDIWEIRDDILIPMLIGVGYHPNTIKNIIIDDEV